MLPKLSMPCTVCGQDVTEFESDKNNNCYCMSCWSLKLERQRQVQMRPGSRQGGSTGADITRDELLFCEDCQGYFTVQHLRDHNGHVLCLDCIKKRSQPVQPTHRQGRTPATVPEHVKEIIATNPLILLAYFAGIMAYIPFLLPLVLVVVWIARRLLNALGVAKQTRWLLGCAIPLIGLLVFARIVEKAAKEVNAHRPKADPLTRFEREHYGRLISLGRIGYGIALCGTVVLLLITGRWGWDNLFGLVGLGVIITAGVKRIPYHRKLRDAGYAKLWFATSNPVEEYNSKLGGK